MFRVFRMVRVSRVSRVSRMSRRAAKQPRGIALVSPIPRFVDEQGLSAPIGGEPARVRLYMRPDGQVLFVVATTTQLALSDQNQGSGGLQAGRARIPRRSLAEDCDCLVREQYSRGPKNEEPDAGSHQ